MMDTEDAESILFETIQRIEYNLFSNNNIKFVYSDKHNAKVAVLSRTAYTNSERLKLEAMKLYCHDINKCAGLPFLVSDKFMRLVRGRGLKTSFGSSIKPYEQLYGIMCIDEFGGEDISYVCIVFNYQELKQALAIYEKVQYLWPSAISSDKNGHFMSFGEPFMGAYKTDVDDFYSWDGNIFYLLENNSDPSFRWEVSKYLES